MDIDVLLTLLVQFHRRFIASVIFCLFAVVNTGAVINLTMSRASYYTKKKICIDSEVHCMGVDLLCSSLNRRGLNPIQSACDHIGQTASAFNWLYQHAKSHGSTTYWYAELAVSSLVMAEIISSTHCTHQDG